MLAVAWALCAKFEQNQGNRLDFKRKSGGRLFIDGCENDSKVNIKSEIAYSCG